MTRILKIYRILELCDELEQEYKHEELFQRNRLNYIKRNFMKLQRAENGDHKNEEN